MQTDFIDDTGHQIPVEFEEPGVARKVFTYLKSLVRG